MTVCSAFQLQPTHRDYVWGGDRLRPGHAPTAEAWVVYEHNAILNGPLAGKTLGQAAAELGAELLGTRFAAMPNTAGRFPLLIKLLDCAQWLSLQVHPNDAQARQRHGQTEFGKTEAWYFIETEPEAKIIAGLERPLTPAELDAAVRDGSIIDNARYVPVRPGDTVLMNAGTVHALGPGMLVYEVQENSDWTYRIYDWGRPQTETRKLHIEESLAVIDAAAVPPLTHADAHASTHLTKSPYFTLDRIQVSGSQPHPVGPESFQALTVIEGQMVLTWGGQSMTLERFATAFLPAGCETVTLESSAAQVLCAALGEG